RLENASPVVKGLGITDYFSLDTYEKVVAAKNAGRLTNIDMIFPNIELRLKLGTAKNSALNAHLLIDPESEDHVAEAKRFLQSLTFSDGSEKFQCSKTDLIRL